MAVCRASVVPLQEETRDEAHGLDCRSLLAIVVRCRRCSGRAPRRRPCRAPPPPPPPADDAGHRRHRRRRRRHRPPPAPKPLTEEEIFATKTLEELNAEKPLHDVYFDYDKADLRTRPAVVAAEERGVAEAVGRPRRVHVEGHCDSRGTAEYNLALGDGAPPPSRDYLVSLGIPATASRSSARARKQPFCTEENESCWSQNRRGHFIVTAK